MKGEQNGSALAAWSLRHPVGVVMIALALVTLGVGALLQLKVDHYPT